MRYTSSKDLNKFIDSLIEIGWCFERGRKHGKLKSPWTGKKYPVSLTPSDRNVSKQVRRSLRGELSNIFM